LIKRCYDGITLGWCQAYHPGS